MAQRQQDGWVVVADADEVCGCRPLVVRRFGEPLVLWRGPDGQLYGQLDRPDRESGDYDPCAPLDAAAHREVREAGGWIWQWQGAERPFYPRVQPPAVRATGVATTSGIECGLADAEALAEQARALGGPGTMTMVVPVDDETAVVYLRSFRQTPALRFVRRMVGAFEHFMVRRRIGGARGRLYSAPQPHAGAPTKRGPAVGSGPVPSPING